MAELLEVIIEDLMLSHREVKKKGVSRYVIRVKAGEELRLVGVTSCEHDGRYHLLDGQHRVVAWYLCGYRTVLAEVDQCAFFGCDGNWEKDSYVFGQRVFVSRFVKYLRCKLTTSEF